MPPVHYSPTLPSYEDTFACGASSHLGVILCTGPASRLGDMPGVSAGNGKSVVKRSR